MRIDVTAEDIRLGTRGSCATCPVARAIRRQTGRAAEFVNYDSIFLRADFGSPDMALILIRVPLDVSYRIIDYDAGDVMEPFTFDLEVPPARSRWLVWRWFHPGWWGYLLEGRPDLRRIWCRVRGHPYGFLWHSYRDELSIRCSNCNEDLG